MPDNLKQCFWAARAELGKAEKLCNVEKMFMKSP